METLEQLSVDELLLILKIGFLVLLYLFIWRIVSSASRDIRVPQESFVLPAGGQAPVQAAGPAPQARLVVVSSPTLPPGSDYALDSTPVTIGRSGQNDLELRGDQFASAAHARFDPRRDGVWLEDLGSTNGTFVNGVKVERARRLEPGDLVRVGETELRYDE